MQDEEVLAKPLSEQQLAIVWLLCNGLTPKEVARQLGLRPSTVYEHLANARQLLNARTLPHLTALAVRCGLVESDVASSSVDSDPEGEGR